MSFLAPLFLLGGLAVALPVLFHLIRRTTRESTRFSSLMFLMPTPPRVTRRSRLENILLLLLRCLAIGLLAFGFARPFVLKHLPSDASAGARAQEVILLDTSASMRREDLWKQALQRVDAAVREAAPGDEAAVVAFDRTTRTLLPFEEWRTLPAEGREAAVRSRLAFLSPSWAGTALGPALLHAADLLESSGDARNFARRRIVVISDLQEGSRLDGLQGYQWPRGVEVFLRPVQTQRAENASVQWISDTSESAQPAAEKTLRVRVANAAGAKREQFQLRWDAPNAAPIEAYAPAGQSRIVRIPKLPDRAGGRLTLTGDEVDFDNTISVLPPQVQQAFLIFLGNEAEDDPAQSLYYLKRAFQKIGPLQIEVLLRRGDSPVPAWELPQAQLLVLGEGVADAALESAREFARSGKIVLLPMTGAGSAELLGRLLGAPAPAAKEAAVKDYAMLADINFQHPFFAPFADPRYSDFTKIHFWKYRKLNPDGLPGARVLARFDSGDPALLQIPLGSGSVAVLTSSWRTADSQLALSSKFVPLLHTMLDQSGNLAVQKAQYVVGDEVSLPSGSQPLTVRKPDGAEVAATPGDRFADTAQPGIYTLSPGDRRFAVNPAPEESRLAAIPNERFAALGVPLEKAAAPKAAGPAERENVQIAASESQQKLWRWLIVAALGVVLIETILAGRAGRAVGAQPEVQP